MNDKQKARWEEVVKEIGWRIYERRLELQTDIGCRKLAKELINLKDSSGNYLIEIPDVEQEKPNLFRYCVYCLSGKELLKREKRLLKNWKKLIPRE